ncbi:ribonuclease E inhibitor RraB [Schaalia canis]|uniref:Ribonuclease E inhibitor RraB n=1 Tax=Schaalia canis TaxID=100469 RepID=A0A3P1SEZ2_9ACTO|nr:ribonuclease E inhibitor RraB [Schaalia canis]RRC95861.1 ribonuclease E inhibitor RraB [Schaalia canis]
MGLFDFFRRARGSAVDEQMIPVTQGANALTPALSPALAPTPRSTLDKPLVTVGTATSHPGDTQILTILSERVDLALPRDQVHYLYFPTEEAARAALVEAQRVGWLGAREGVYQLDGYPDWSMTVRRDDQPTNATTMPGIRAFFEELAERFNGEYDGWEAAGFDV